MEQKPKVKWFYPADWSEEDIAELRSKPLLARPFWYLYGCMVVLR